jgi:hypothetical protein
MSSSPRKTRRAPAKSPATRRKETIEKIRHYAVLPGDYDNRVTTLKHAVSVLFTMARKVYKDTKKGQTVIDGHPVSKTELNQLVSEFKSRLSSLSTYYKMATSKHGAQYVRELIKYDRALKRHQNYPDRYKAPGAMPLTAPEKQATRAPRITPVQAHEDLMNFFRAMDLKTPSGRRVALPSMLAGSSNITDANTMLRIYSIYIHTLEKHGQFVDLSRAPGAEHLARLIREINSSEGKALDIRNFAARDWMVIIHKSSDKVEGDKPKMEALKSRISADVTEVTQASAEWRDHDKATRPSRPRPTKPKAKKPQRRNVLPE